MEAKIKPLEELHIVKEFPDVFPEDLTQLLSDRDIEFAIDLIPSAALLSKCAQLNKMRESQDLFEGRCQHYSEENRCLQRRLASIGLFPSPSEAHDGNDDDGDSDHDDGGDDGGGNYDDDDDDEVGGDDNEFIPEVESKASSSDGEN
ncbi:late secretory pathway protein AVL9-like [Telopea speciosissima]|uniref:late secretory pathway protein AVL9-like n=1 Tax=Telopea speciosissima TaxID=54955 RepID=UPI001CC53387|nr:late secretory pathway protein AVL9-like [Telopea speciosissima]